MTISKVLAASFFLAMIFITALASASDWEVAEKVRYDWAGDNKPYDFVLRKPAGYNDAGEYTQLQIMQKGEVFLQLNDEGGLASLADALTQENKQLKEKNLLKSNNLLMIPTLRGNSKHPLLLLFGWAYGSSPGSLHIIALGDDGIPKEILNLENFEIHSIADLDRDTIPELIGYPCFSQTWGPDNSFLTYDPFHVYRFGASATSTIKLDLDLTEIYNKNNYYGWAGAECSEDIAVVLRPHDGGKPVVMDAAKAKAMFEKH